VIRTTPVPREPHHWALFAVYGFAQVLLTFAVCLPLERWRPIEHWLDCCAVLTDAFYTVLERVGLLSLVTFIVFYNV